MEEKIGVVAASLIVNNKNEVLLFKSTKWQGWMMPGGHVEYGETAKDACIRETKEETGLDIELGELINFGERINPATFYKQAHLVYFHFLAKIKSGETKLDQEELTDSKWFSPQEALAKCDPAIKVTLERYLQKING
ncbi:MAG: NUDIX hydrolase [bacterium]|nr:NUDIX hydrolase [bacterium]